MEKPSKELSVWSKRTSYAKLWSDKKPTNWICTYIIVGVFMVFISLLMPVSFIFASESFEEAFEYILPCLFIIVPCLGMAIWFLTIPKKIKIEYASFMAEIAEEHKKEKREYEKWEKEHPHWEAEEFYREMREAGFTDIDSATQKEKLHLYLKNNDINLPQQAKSAEQFFKLGKREVERIEKAAYISEIKQEELKTHKILSKYAKCDGRKKLTEYCKDKISFYQQQINNYIEDEERVKNGGEALYSLGKQPEHDWAIHGGIASGIAGVGAGVATAINIQNKNSEIRENNKNLAKLIGTAIADQRMIIWKLKGEAEDNLKHWENELKKCELKLIRNPDISTLMEKLNIEVDKYNVSESGAVVIDLTCCSKEKLFIDEKLPANIDGTLKVTIKSEGEIIGTTCCVLPYRGIHSYKTSVQCICTSIDATGKELEFTFEPNNIWLVEQ